MRIREDDLERLGDLVLRGAAADIEKVRRLAAVQLDDIHGGHGEARAVDHAADGAVELHIGQAEPLRLDLGGFLLIKVAQRLDVWMTEHGVVVEADLGVEAVELAVLGHHERVDLDEARVFLQEKPVERGHQLGALLCLIAFELERGGDDAGMEGAEPRGRIDGKRDDLFRRLGRNLFDVHSAFGRGDEGDAA